MRVQCTATEDTITDCSSSSATSTHAEHKHGQLIRPITLIACQLICRAIASIQIDSEVPNTRCSAKAFHTEAVY